MSASRKRDLSQAQMENRLRKLGWSPQGFMGYWRGPSGIASFENAGAGALNHYSAAGWNYSRRRDVIRDMQRIDREHAARKAAKAVPQ